MATDLSALVTLQENVIGDAGGMAIISYSSSTAADYIDMDTVLGHDVNVVFAAGVYDYAGTATALPMIWTGTTTTPDRITVGAGPSTNTILIVVFYQARKSTGGGWT